MPDDPASVTNPALQQRLNEIQDRIRRHLATVDPHHRLQGRPVTYQVIAGQTLEIVYRDVPGIEDAELLAVRRLVGENCCCSVTPQTAETLTVRFVVPLSGSVEGGSATSR